MTRPPTLGRLEMVWRWFEGSSSNTSMNSPLFVPPAKPCSFVQGSLASLATVPQVPEQPGGRFKCWKSMHWHSSFSKRRRIGTLLKQTIQIRFPVVLTVTCKTMLLSLSTPIWVKYENRKTMRNFRSNSNNYCTKCLIMISDKH